MGHLAARLARPPAGNPGRLQFLPLAVEYTWWHERQPEVLLLFGQPLEVTADTAAAHSPEEWSDLLERRLELAQDALAFEAQGRDPSRFQNLLSGTAGVGGVYDLWRRFRAALRGRSFDPRHGTL